MEWLMGKKGETKTDSNIMDEAAGRARITMAAQAKERRLQEKKDLARKNADMKKRLAMHRQTQRTDDNLDDEEAGRMRAVKAQQAKARRAEEERALDKANDSIFGKIRSTGVRTDDDIMDEDAGRYRLQLAAESKERFIKEADDLAAKNRYIAQRLARVRPQVPLTSNKGKEEFSKAQYVDPYKFVPPRAVDPDSLVRKVDEPANPKWLGKYDKYDWEVPVVV